MKVHPEISEDVRSLIPPPDLAAMEERLNQFKRNIYKVVKVPVRYLGTYLPGLADM